MDPLTLMITVLTAGAAAAGKDFVSEAVKDAYAGLKRRLAERFAAKPDVTHALQQIEAKPDSAARLAVLREELQAAQADQDPDLRQLAERLFQLLQREQLLPATTYQACQTGSGALAQGEKNVAAGQGGIAIGGNVQGSSLHRPEK